MPNLFKSSRMRTLIVVFAAALLIMLSLSGCVTNAAGESESVFSIILVRPFAWILGWIYSWCGNFGLSLILFCLLTRLIMLPFNIRSKRSMLRMQVLQPKVREIEKKYPNDKNKQSVEMMALYKKEGVSPMSGCLPSLITIPLMFALYWPISQPLKYLMHLSGAQIKEVAQRLVDLGATVGNTTVAVNSSQMTLVQAISDHFDAVKGISENIFRMDLTFLGMNLGATPNFRIFDALFLLPIISAATSYLMMQVTKRLQEKKTGVKEGEGQNQSQMMTWMMPLMSLWIGFTLPAGLAVYWISGNVIGILQELLINSIVQVKKEGPEEAKKPHGQKNRKKR